MFFGTACSPARKGNSDAFSFGGENAHEQTARNMMLMMTMPWAAAWVIGSEMAQEALKGVSR